MGLIGICVCCLYITIDTSTHAVSLCCTSENRKEKRISGTQDKDRRVPNNLDLTNKLQHHPKNLSWAHYEMLQCAYSVGFVLMETFISMIHKQSTMPNIHSNPVGYNNSNLKLKPTCAKYTDIRHIHTQQYINLSTARG